MLQLVCCKDDPISGFPDDLEASRLVVGIFNAELEALSSSGISLEYRSVLIGIFFPRPSTLIFTVNTIFSKNRHGLQISDSHWKYNFLQESSAQNPTGNKKIVITRTQDVHLRC